MYETNIVRSGAEAGLRDAVYGADGLRSLSWTELVARLAAARDFRRVMGDRLLAGGSSFNLVSARHLVGRGEGKPGINPFALANGKSADGMRSSEMENDIRGDRGR